MSRRFRTGLFLAAALPAAALWCWGAWGLPGFGRYPGPYGDVIDHLVTRQRHATEAVAAVTFDYRGFDTLGEEFILFTSALGAAVLLRALQSERDGRSPRAASGRRAPEASEATRLAGPLLAAPLVVLGMYVVTHGHLTPGGGFQGGVILAAAAFVVILSGRRVELSPLLPRGPAELGDAVGAAGFAGLGLAMMALGGAYLQDLLPKGVTGQLDSAGFIPILNALVALEVASALVLIVSELLTQLQEPGR
ncbi:MAG: MnhB domain-containing protein [Candidatus Dormibacterales bacterium]